jgi:DNA mismatch repair protein MutS
MIVNYLRQQESYTERYADRTIVLMQIGSFYEMYEFNPEKCDEKYDWPKKRIGLVEEIAKLLNMVITSKDKKKPYTLTNCNMIGFPVVSYEKHRDVLLQNDYTVVRIDQKKNIKDGKDEIERFVAEILSPSINLENIANLPITNNIVSIYIEILKKSFHKEDYILAIGLSSIDVTTGQNSVLEIYSQDKNSISALQEVYRYLSIISPREIVLTVQFENKNSDDEYSDFLNGLLNLDKIPNCILKKCIEKDFLKIEYQTKFLSKVFNENSSTSTSIIEDLSLERISYGRISYIILLQHCYEHNVQCIEKLNKPNTSWLDQEKYLILTHNAISQLNLLPESTNKKKHNRSNKNIDSLFSVINHTRTALGKRYLMSMLTSPITDIDKLNESYDRIQYCLENKTLVKEISSLLSFVPDIERYQRKLYLKIIKPHELSILFQGYLKIVEIYTRIYNEGRNGRLFSLLFDSSDFSQCLSKVLSKFNLESLSKSRIESAKIIYLGEESENVENVEDDECGGKEDISNTLIYPGVDAKFDKYCEDLKNTRSRLNEIVDVLNSHLEKTKGKKIVYNSDSKKDKNLGLWTTPHKASILQQAKISGIDGLSFINVNKEVMITSNEIAAMCKKLVELQSDISKYLYSSYMCTINDISCYSFFSTLTDFISKVDFTISGSISATENKYFRPKIEGESSFLSIQNMRHPIVECLISGGYISNDLALQRGLLLYGQNSSGKSTFGKAIALNVILAQAGLFTAGELRYYPFQKIITRLSDNDNVMEGLSSFVIEMKELRTILRNADASSLIIADEIARGTESVSAVSLTVSAVNYLLEKKSSFIFSTHLHSLVEMSDIKNWKEKNKLMIAHLALKYDEKRNILVYDRKLKDGPGDSVYGLEVAQSLNLDTEFISHAYNVRKEIVREGNLLLSTKKSRYNGKVYIDSCQICGCKDVKKLQTHHILEQHTADENGYIGSIHKNIPGNLVEICDTCHMSLHQNKIKLSQLTTSPGLSIQVLS